MRTQGERDFTGYKFPRDTPKPVRETLEPMLSTVHSILGKNLKGIYLYGSLAMGCFQPRSSDIDVILVVKEKLTKEVRNRIFEYLKKTRSKNKRIELSIVSIDSLQEPHYPMLVDLHYEYWGNTFENQRDNEILSNLYTTRKRGFCVWGTSKSKAFSRISGQYHLRSVIEDLEHTRSHLHEKPELVGYDVATYWILGSCRILAFIRERKVLSKIEGGQWGLTNLPEDHRKLVEQALSYYHGEKKDSVWNHNELETFADYMTNAILGESQLKKHEQASLHLPEDFR